MRADVVTSLPPFAQVHGPHAGGLHVMLIPPRVSTGAFVLELACDSSSRHKARAAVARVATCLTMALASAD